jgi:hypothetical protein
VTRYALNGAPAVNGSSRNGLSLNGAWVAPSTLPHHEVGPPAVEIPTTNDTSSGDLESERKRLEAEIAAQGCTEAAIERAEARDAEVRAVLHAELLASRDALAEMEREHEEAVAAIHSAAQAEVERILADARLAPGHPAGTGRSQASEVSDV